MTHDGWVSSSTVPTVGGLTFGAIADAYGTPSYAYDADVIRRRVGELHRAVDHDPLRLFYSVKAHPSVALLRLLRRLGVGADACSPGDLAYAEAAGLSGDEITFTGVSMAAPEREAIRRTGAFFVADSVAQIVEAAGSDRPTEVGLRVNCGITAGFHPLVESDAPGTKFGVPTEGLGEAVKDVEARGSKVVGLHGHVGSDLLDPHPHIELLARLLDLTRAHVPNARMVDIGGGWGTPFLPRDAGRTYPPPVPLERYPLEEFGLRAASLLKQHRDRTGTVLELRLEPGAYLTMEAGYLVARVTDVKEAEAFSSASRPRNIAVLDTSYNHLHSAVAHATFHELWADVSDDRPLMRQDVVGNLMQAGDRLASDRLLPLLSVGDVVAFGRAGAYKASRAPTFNGRPRPAEVLVDRGGASLVRRHETVEDLLRLEVDER